MNGLKNSVVASAQPLQFPKFPAPCDGCPNTQKCKSEKLACRDFLYFVTEGKVRKTASRNMPSRTLFDLSMEG